LRSRADLPLEDRWILSRLDHVTAEVGQLMNDFALNEAGHRLYDFLWNEYCDWYVEFAKVRLRDGGQADPRPVLVHVLETGLRLLHPYMPYVTEELWQRLRPFMPKPDAGALIVAPFPTPDPAWQDSEAEGRVEQMIDVIRAIRNIRAEKNVEPARTVDAYVVSTDSAALLASSLQIETLARATLRAVAVATDAPTDGVATAVLPGAQVIVPLAGLLDVEAEGVRLRKEISDTEEYLSRIDAKLKNEQFRSRAPANVVAAEEERRSAAQSRLEGLQRALSELW
jgi:valyl-tRNA synthetase